VRQRTLNIFKYTLSAFLLVAALGGDSAPRRPEIFSYRDLLKVLVSQGRTAVWLIPEPVTGEQCLVNRDSRLRPFRDGDRDHENVARCIPRYINAGHRTLFRPRATKAAPLLIPLSTETVREIGCLLASSGKEKAVPQEWRSARKLDLRQLAPLPS